MSNYYTGFSVAIELKPETVKFAYDLYNKLRDHADDSTAELKQDIMTHLTGDTTDWDYIGFTLKVESETELWMYDEESAMMENVAEFIRTLLEYEQSDKFVYVEWANTCSKPMLDGFSGGGMAVTKEDTEWFFPSAACREWEKKREAAV